MRTGKQVKASSTRLAVVVLIVALEYKVNPVEFAFIRNGMLTLIIHFHDFANGQVWLMRP